MTFIKKSLTAMAAVAAMGSGQAIAEWEPSNTINVIIPWGAGGSTDQVTRAVIPILEEALNNNVVPVNQPGASGATGTRGVLDGDPNGYTWTANAIANNATYAVTGLIEDTSIDDWHIYISVAHAPVVSVPSNSEFEDFGQLLEAFQERGDSISVATAGITSSGGTAIASVADAGGFDYNMITYDGGNPAITAAARGEAMVTTQLAAEQAEMIRGDRLRPLAVLSEEPLEMEGAGTIPSITEWLPDMEITPDYFGIMIPKGVPDEVISTMDRIWEDYVMTSDSLREYAQSQGAVFDPSFGEEARSRAMPTVIHEACAYVQRGEAEIDPIDIGIDCDTRSEVR
ncbi:tripartite tricarboxylate transporter substrate binding protein [Natronospirillum operosum]|uniref:Tripartite tricarboxylate transporter substrate binding protein n=1 Tax=Natronospirillum operosum TaxID=2759953 RepID=A0A4Z0W9D4_9GAMM|nr:tripartite tricarboxylate transporter substrate binding protein [Natronospirillum operosum]TGG93579.1 tripartite tricarboxylate transporter substrate binding protein [Natronospirillum operosum]